MKPVTFGQVGVGGYARYYLDHFQRNRGRTAVLRAVVSNDLERDRYFIEHFGLRKQGIHIYGSFEELVAGERGKIDAIALPVGIPFHAPYSILALKNGFHVLCEKPPAATLQDIDAMISAKRETGRELAVGFQAQYTADHLEVKRRICNGEIGEIREVRFMGAWNRPDTYYARNDWAGRLKNGRGEWILDGTINNPFAHDVMKALYFASREWMHAAGPARMRAELYKGHAIESENTSCFEAVLDNGARFYFWATLCGPRDLSAQRFIIQGSRGAFELSGSTWIQTDENGAKVREIQSPGDGRYRVLENMADVLNRRAECFCPVEMTRPFVLAMNGAFAAAGAIRAIPAGYITRTPFKSPDRLDPAVQTDDCYTEVPGIEALMQQCFAERKMFSEAGAPWARPGNWMDLGGLNRF